MTSAFATLLALVWSLLGVEVKFGGLSVYWPGDSCRTGRVLACDTYRYPLRYDAGSVHLAMRRWRSIGCWTSALVCSVVTFRCEFAPVLDGGPYGIVRGRLRRARAEGRYRVFVGTRPPRGWRFRAVADLSRELWTRLGRPPTFSSIAILYVRRGS